MCVFPVSTWAVQKPGTPCASLRTPRRPSRQLRKPNTPCASRHVSMRAIQQRAARSSNAREERWPARSGCGGERGGESSALARAHSQHCGPTPPSAKKNTHGAHFLCPSSSHTGTSQSDEIFVIQFSVLLIPPDVFLELLGVGNSIVGVFGGQS